jgi:hypothetical protein
MARNSRGWARARNRSFDHRRCRPFVGDLRTQLGDPQVIAIVLEVDSPGGQNQGCHEPLAASVVSRSRRTEQLHEFKQLA